MADFHIRIKGLDEQVKVKLKKDARDHGLSLNKYVCNILTDYTRDPSLRSTEEKYTNLAKDLVSLYEQILSKTNEALAENTYMLKKIMNMIEEGEAR